MRGVYSNKELVDSTFLQLLHDQLEVDIPVYGLSMFPFYLPGDVIRVRKVSFENLKKGDVIVFVQNNRLVAHRLLSIDKKNKCAVSKGDGLLKKDSLLKKVDVVAVVTLHVRNETPIKWYNNSTAKKTIATISPLLGYISHPLSFIWYKYLYQNR
jgi:signal peptidase I